MKMSTGDTASTTNESIAGDAGYGLFVEGAATVQYLAGTPE